MVDLSIIIGGNSFSDPVEWSELDVLCTYDNGSIQPNISLEKVTFVNDAAHFIIGYIADSKRGVKDIFSAIPIQFIVSEGNISKTVFDGYIDTLNDFEIVNPVKVEARIVRLDSLNDVEYKLKALSFGYLENLGILKDSDYTDVKTIYRASDRDLQIAQLALSELLIVSQFANIPREQTSDASLEANSLGTLSGWFAVKKALDLVYYGIMIVQFVRYMLKIQDLILPIPHKNKGITFRKAFEAICTKLGYGFNTTIEDIDRVYLPSKPDVKERTKGIPHVGDYGYTCIDMVELFKTLTNSKIAVVNGTMELHNITAPFWQVLSTYKIPPVLHESVVFNTNEYVANKLYSFSTDISDEWTIKNYKGTSCEIITAPIVERERKYQLNHGFEKIDFGVALGNNSGALDSVQIYYQSIANVLNDNLRNIESVVNSIISKVGGNRPPINFITFNPILNDVLMVSGKTWNIPKVLYVVNNGIPTNHRSKLSALVLWRKYYASTSFMPSNKYGQKRIFKDVKVPFQFSNFVELLSCSFATTYSGNKQAKVESIKWRFDKDYAVMDYWVNEVYNSNLKEIIIEP